MQSQNTQKSRILSETIICEKKWLGLNHINFSIGEKIIQNYEGVYRPQRKKKNSDIDGVQIIPIIKHKEKNPELVFIANFRPPIGHFCIEFPAGLLQNQNFEQNGLRELEEETGYVAEKILKLPNLPIHCDPWKSNEAGYLFVGIINGDDPQHKKSQALQTDENIRILTVPIDGNLSETLSKLAIENNYKIHTKVWSFCLGFNLANFL